jgi:glutathione S-transferase
MTSLCLTYLPIAARGFPIRFALRVAGRPFEDKRLPREDLVTGRGSTGYNPTTFPLGQLPTLSIDGELFTESVALSRYAAQGTVLYPTDPLEALRVEEVVAIIDELWSKVPMARHFNMQDPVVLLQARDNFNKAVAPRFLERLSARVGTKGSPFVLASGPSLADVWLTAFAVQVGSGAYTIPEPGPGAGGVPTTLLEGYPALTACVAAFKGHPLFVAHGEPM